VLSTTAGKIPPGIAGMTGTGGLGITAATLARIASAHTVPTGIWVVLASLWTATVMVAGLGLVLDYCRARLEIATRDREARSRAELQGARLTMYRVLVEKSAGEPGSAADYRDLILADALHLAVEQNSVRPADRTHGQLYGRQTGNTLARGAEIGE
jgi:hypothetical protein